jgi:hypothetical protein
MHETGLRDMQKPADGASFIFVLHKTRPTTAEMPYLMQIISTTLFTIPKVHRTKARFMHGQPLRIARRTVLCIKKASNRAKRPFPPT